MLRNTALTALLCIGSIAAAQESNQPVNDSNTPLHLLKPAYQKGYGVVTAEEVKQDMDRILHYLENNTPTRVVDSRTGSVITDYAKIDEHRATYTGISMSWETWAAPLLDYLTAWRAARRWDMVEVMQGAMLRLYYHAPYYLTVPKAVRVAVVKWVYQFLKDGAAPFPFAGDMGSEEYSFTVDFEKDVEIVPNRSIKDDMAAYNRQANAEKGRRRVEKRFADLTGDQWTTAELKAQGFTKRNIDSFVENGLIKRLYKGHYMRVSE